MSIRILMKLVTMAVIATTMPANAMTAEAFLLNLDSLPPDSPDMAAFHAYLRGAMDTMVLYTKALESDGHDGMICVPAGTEFDLDDLRAMVSQALEARPDQAGEPFSRIVITSFAESFPCP